MYQKGTSLLKKSLRTDRWSRTRFETPKNEALGTLNEGSEKAPRSFSTRCTVFGTLPSPLKGGGAFSYRYPPPLHSVSITTRIGEYTRPLPRSYE